MEPEQNVTKQQSIILGIVVGTILSSSYLSFINVLCCIGIIGAAMTAVWHYTTENELTITSGEGAVMGLIVAAGAVIMATLLDVLVLDSIGIGSSEVARTISEFSMGMFKDSIPPAEYAQALADMEQELADAKTMSGRLIQVAQGLLASGIMGAIGGAIGASRFKKGGELTYDDE